MKKRIAVLMAGVIAGSASLGAAGAADGWPKAEALLVPFEWVAGGKTMSAATTFDNGTERVPSSMNYKGTTYIPIRLAAESLGYTLHWEQSTATATLVDSESTEDPVSDIPGKYPSASITTSTRVAKDTTLRAAASKDGKKLAALKAGTNITVLGEGEEGWIRVISGNQMGWAATAATDYVPAAKRPKWEQTADSIIDVGLTYLGTEYEFDANLGQTNTFDCSSFVNYVFELHGVNMPRNSRQQSAVGDGISFEELRKGDLVFFTTPKREKETGVNRIGHVGIYVGDNKLLHTYRKGIGVTVTLMDDHWKGRFVKAQRVI